MSKYFEISGYWKDNNEPFEGYIVKEYDDVDENDDDIFEYGWSEEDLKRALNVEDYICDWVLTSFKEVELN